jgi:D-beta-D-heptose 7-phosphate kinase/D-beta-D-heptose 1-phosphate adenosyltransferase
MSLDTETRTSVSEKIYGLAGARVLIVGDIMLDHFVHGGIERISPEAPVPVLLGSRKVSMLGGAGNVAANVHALGGVPDLVALLGQDEEAEEIRRICRRDGVSDDGLVPVAGRRSSIKTRFIANGQQVLRFDSETVGSPDDAGRDLLFAAFDARLANADIVVLSDYGKGALTNGVAAKLIARARAAGRKILVDPKGDDYRIYSGATYVTPNRKELSAATKMPVDGDAAIVAASRHLIETAALEGVIATRSEEGMSIVERGTEIHIPTVARSVFDVSGAGDTVVASLSLALARGLPLIDAAHIANAAAGVVVAKVGTSQVSPQELIEEIESDPGAARETPHAIADARRLVAEWQQAGLEVGFTNGVFDIVHPGHIALLTQARARCDRLVVGLNADSSVRRLGKGPERPINSEQSRAIVMAALRPVDLVVLFEEDTPAEVISALQPDVLIKGADYRLDQIVGADFVLARGGRVERIDLVEGQSTTNIVRRMRA